MTNPTPKIMRHFNYGHLPPKLRDVSQMFGELAMWMANNLPDNDERKVGLRKLLEAKDCAVRAKLDEPK